MHNFLCLLLIETLPEIRGAWDDLSFCFTLVPYPTTWHVCVRARVRVRVRMHVCA